MERMMNKTYLELLHGLFELTVVALVIEFSDSVFSTHRNTRNCL